jgi:uncharacterized membrane protein
MADKRIATREDTWHKIALCFCLILTILFPVTLVLLWHIGLHGIVVGVFALLVCLPACGCWLSSA